MSWNRSNGAQKPEPGKPSAMRGIIAGGVVVLAACAALFFLFSGGDDAPKAKVEKERGRIKEVTPAAAPKPVAVTNSASVKLPETYIDEHGVKRYKGGLRVRSNTNRADAVDLTIGSDGKPLYKAPLFKHRCENEIATLITMSPGGTLVGKRTYGEKFKQDFIEALMTKNEPTPEDSPRDAELKRQVDETKKELAARVREGEDIEKIFADCRREMQKLSTVRRDIMKEVMRQVRDPSATPDDISLVYEAANKLLAQKGIAPLKKSPLLDHSIKFSASEKNNHKEKTE